MMAIVTTLRNKTDAVRIGRALLEKRLIASYNLWPVESAYRLNSEIVEEPGAMMIMKTTIRWFDDIADYIKAQSGHGVLDVIAFDAEKVDPSFQAWVNDQIQ